ncbi:MAG: ergothioneine biosynthesis protein EgtB [Woeseiaceae bacterium]|nr:ergothioneine biosynthesis protein EgtB [Woeseiaceae bacterium]
MASPAATVNTDLPKDLADRFRRVRADSVAFCDTLAAEDTVVQSMPDVSPTKWHLAHISWFFETFVLKPFDDSYTVFDEDFHFIFNSYYYTAGQMHARPRRGLLSRPTLETVIAYRRHVDDAIVALLKRRDEADIRFRVELGLHHERQHQELMLTDIKHVLSCSPLKPAMNPALPVPASSPVADHKFIDGSNGLTEIGFDGEGFSFDNETPRHDALLHPHSLGNRLVTNAEYREFIRDGAYEKSDLWLSDGWATIKEQGWNRPLYWSADHQSEFTLGGVRDLDPNAPVAHVSFYEADAFARWSGARLPTEFEWEASARDSKVSGNLLETGFWHPAASDGPQFFGDVWEWTASSYSAYPGFKPLAGSLGEYNGKFMCNQMTVRGGSCVSAADHIRPTYRSFFYPDARWQFLGIRLAKDA